LSALRLLVAADKDFEEVLVAAPDKVGALFDHLVFFARVVTLDWTRTKNHKALKLMTGGLCTHADWLAGNSGGMMVGNHNGSYHIVKAPS
jgi:hypothetical protein